MHGSGHCSNKQVSNGQVYDEVGRALAQVTISSDSENGETVYNGYHSQFSEEDCEPLGPKQWRRRTRSCFIAHSRVSRLFQGASVMFPLVCPMTMKKRFEIFSNFFALETFKGDWAGSRVD